MTLLYLVRHGETDWNRAGRIQGSTDIPLNDLGREQAARAGVLLARRRWAGIVSSPLSRALETARIIGAEVGIDEIEIVDDLAERRYGSAEGLNDRQLRLLFAQGDPIPGRETPAGLTARIVPALLALAERNPSGNLIVATHGAVIRNLLMTADPDTPYQQGVPITNGSIHSFRVDDGGLRLIAFDDPVDEESVGGGDLIEQNPIERAGI